MVQTEDRTVALSFSSNQPLVRWWGIEILDHSKKAVRLERAKNGLAFLYNHNTDLLIGKMNEVTIDPEEGKGRGVARFSRSALGEEKFQEVQDDILTEVSVGYAIHNSVELTPEEMSDEVKALALREKLPVYLVKDWEPLEASLVPIPADYSVGVGRELEQAEREEAPVEVLAPVPEPQKEVRTMPDKEREQELAQERASAVRESAQKERERVSEIYTLSSKHRVPHFVRDKALQEGTSIEEFRGQVLQRIGEGKPLDTPPTDLGLSPSDAKRYSICRAILSLDPTVRGVEAGFERECHDEISKRLGKTSKGIFIPYDVMRQPATDRYQRGQRDLVVGTPSAGGYLVGTDTLGSEFIDILRNRMLIRSLGARVLSGLKGNVVIPRRTAGAATAWVTEGNAPGEGSNTFGQLALSPKNIAANVDYTRNLLLQSNPSVDGLVNGDLAIGIALGVDLAAFHGSGAAGQPTGIENTGSIGSVVGTSLAWAGILEFEEDVAGANADVATCAYVTTPSVRALLKQRVKFSGTNSPLWESGAAPDRSGSMNGYRAEVSNQIEAATMFFGDFSQVVLAEWGVLELLVDPYTQSKAGIIQVTAFQTVDVGVRYPAAFSMAQVIT